MLDAVRGTSVPAAGALGVAEAAGVTVVPLAWSFANPAGPVQDEAFERIAALICASLSHALDEAALDGVYLDLHGAAVVDSFPDAEGELLRRVDPKHRSLGQFFQDEIASPLRADVYIRLPEDIPNSRLATLAPPGRLLRLGRRGTGALAGMQRF